MTYFLKTCSILLLGACLALGAACGSTPPFPQCATEMDAICTCTCAGVAVPDLEAFGATGTCNYLQGQRCSACNYLQGQQCSDFGAGHDGGDGGDAGSPPVWESCVVTGSTSVC
jgi:hypothetical protein